jgi:hypothetical protein
MAFDAHKNFAVSSVAVAPSPAASGTSLTVASGDGARFPAAPFNGTVCPAQALATPANAEIVRVTAIAGDVLTIVRAQEGTTARAIAIGDLIAATITAKTVTDLESGVNFPQLATPGSVAVGAGTPSQNGAIRLENANAGPWRGVVTGRNQANTADVVMMYLAPDSAVTLGQTPAGVLSLNASGSINSPTQPRASATRSATQQSFAPASWIYFTFDTEVFDVGNCFSLGSPTALYVQTGGAGLYLVMGAVTFDANSTGARYLQLQRNGVGLQMLSGTPLVGDVTTMPISVLASLNAGDAIQLAAYQGSGVALNCTGTLSMVKLW